MLRGIDERFSQEAMALVSFREIDDRNFWPSISTVRSNGVGHWSSNAHHGSWQRGQEPTGLGGATSAFFEQRHRTPRWRLLFLECPLVRIEDDDPCQGGNRGKGDTAWANDHGPSRSRFRPLIGARASSVNAVTLKSTSKSLGIANGWGGDEHAARSTRSRHLIDDFAEQGKWVFGSSEHEYP